MYLRHGGRDVCTGGRDRPGLTRVESVHPGSSFAQAWSGVPIPSTLSEDAQQWNGV
jgi:hypothetical protein